MMGRRYHSMERKNSGGVYDDGKRQEELDTNRAMKLKTTTTTKSGRHILACGRVSGNICINFRATHWLRASRITQDERLTVREVTHVGKVNPYMMNKISYKGKPHQRSYPYSFL